MSTTGRRTHIPVTQDLTERSCEYAFFQAVRQLERASVFARIKDGKITSKPVANFFKPTTEAIRFHTHQSLSFPSSEIKKISQRVKNEGKQWDMYVNFIGLTGAMGVLPYHYTEMILKRLKMKDESLYKFLDLFNHRIISLFYQAGTKYRMPLDYERKKLNPPLVEKYDSHTKALLSIIGMGTAHLNNRLHTRDESLLYYSGLFSHSIKSSSALKQIIQSHFNVPVDIKEFIGQWQYLIDDVRTCLPSRITPGGRNNRLGKSVMLGKQGWFAQGKIRIILGPLNQKQFESFAPGTTSLQALNEIVRLYLGMEHDYDFIIRIKRQNIPEKIQMGGKTAPIIGWNTWLSSKAQRFSQDETLDIKVSSGRFK
ncbi:MAG: type VI secretion system baseplate subunit TssG [Gammaproteobacteria bacterium]|nr:type VI secretion system baseplate subunit TssG [Gammaproteobacteria bacterium]